MPTAARRILPLLLLLAAHAAAAEDAGYALTAADIPGKRYTEDYAPSQVLEVIRPDGGPVAIGRIMTSCSCLTATVPVRDVPAGEPAIIEIRVVKRPPAPGAAYAVMVELDAPRPMVLIHAVTVPETDG